MAKKKEPQKKKRSVVDRLLRRRPKQEAPPAGAAPERCLLVELAPMRRASASTEADPNLPNEPTDGIFFSSPKTADVVFGIRALALSPEVQPRFLSLRARLFWDGDEAATVAFSERPVTAGRLAALDAHVEDIERTIDWTARTEPPDGAAVLMQVSGTALAVVDAVPVQVPFRGKVFLRATRAHG